MPGFETQKALPKNRMDLYIPLEGGKDILLIEAMCIDTIDSFMIKEPENGDLIAIQITGKAKERRSDNGRISCGQLPLSQM